MVGAVKVSPCILMGATLSSKMVGVVGIMWSMTPISIVWADRIGSMAKTNPPITKLKPKWWYIPWTF